MAEFVESNQINVEVEADVRQPITVEVSNWRGVQSLSIRHWYETSQGAFARTQKGVLLPLADGEKLIAAIQEAMSQAGQLVTQKQLL